jgi:hypothetical protein
MKSKLNYYTPKATIKMAIKNSPSEELDISWQHCRQIYCQLMGYCGLCNCTSIYDSNEVIAEYVECKEVCITKYRKWLGANILAIIYVPASYYKLSDIKSTEVTVDHL